MRHSISRAHSPRTALCGIGLVGIGLSLALPIPTAEAVVWRTCTSHDTKFGWVWADRASTSSYMPNADYQWNSNGYQSWMVRNGTGRYEVRIPRNGLDYGGNVHVTAYGTDNTYCKVEDWYLPSSSSNQEYIEVRCFDANGTPKDSRFTAFYLDDNRGCTDTTYALADRPTTAVYEPAYPYSYAALDRTLQAGYSGLSYDFEVRRNYPGRYTTYMPVRRPEQPSSTLAQGIPFATAVGTDSTRCGVANGSVLGFTGPPPLIHEDNDGVVCSDATGATRDTQFNILDIYEGVPGWLPSGDNAGAAVHVRDAWSPVVELSINTSGESNSVSRVSTGVYDVNFAGVNAGKGTVIVSANHHSLYSADETNYCKVEWWWPWGDDVLTRVRCYDEDGNLASHAGFSAAYITNGAR